MNTINHIREFLAQKRFAMVGVSRDPKDFSRTLFHEFCNRGYDVVPVNPRAKTIDGLTCFSHVHDIRPAVTSALLMIPKQATEEVLRDCSNARVTLAWIYGVSGQKDINPAARSIAEGYGIKLIPGYCPYMFLARVAWFHRFHGFIWNTLGLYPH